MIYSLSHVAFETTYSQSRDFSFSVCSRVLFQFPAILPIFSVQRNYLNLLMYHVRNENASIKITGCIQWGLKNIIIFRPWYLKRLYRINGYYLSFKLMEGMNFLWNTKLIWISHFSSFLLHNVSMPCSFTWACKINIKILMIWIKKETSPMAEFNRRCFQILLVYRCWTVLYMQKI